MKFSKPFTSTSSMSNFGTSSKPAPTQRSAPSSALDIVSASGVDNWDLHLSSLAETTPSIAQEDPDLMDSPNFGLSIPSFSTTLDSDSLASEVFPWDSSNFSTNNLSSTDSALGHIHTSSFSLLTRPPASSHTAAYSLSAADNTDLSTFSYSSYPLLPVLSAAPYDVSSTTEPPATISPADTQFLALSQIAPQRQEVKSTSMAQPSQIKQEAPREETKPTVTPSRETSMEVDDDDDIEEGDYDDDMDEEDGGDEYRERSRGRRKDGSIARSAATSAARKSDTASTDGAASNAKRVKTTGAKQSSGSDSGSTPAPKRRGATRISVADFVPPDVTGLSKREARLVKNRAAAFLSRQRKREEFETMEVRLQAILEENERLKRDSSGTPTASTSDEVERLQQMLKVAEEREKALKDKLEEQTRLAEQARIQAQAQMQAKAIKVEEPIISLQDALKLQSPVPSQLSAPFKEKESTRHGPGFNLMVLVFSLTLLSMPHQHQLQSSMGGAQPTRFNWSPSGSATAAAFPTLFENVLERWEGTNRIKAVDNLDSIDEDDEMEVEVEPWEETSESQNKSGSSYVIDFEMPVVADEVGKDDEGKIKVRISPCGVPRPRRANGGLKPGEVAWEGSALPPLESNGLDLSANAFAADWESWGGWKEFLSDDLVGSVQDPALIPDIAGPATSIGDVSSPRSDFEQSVAVGTEENNSESWATPPPFPATLDNEESPMTSLDAVKTPAGAAAEAVPEDQKPVDVDVALSTLPSWSRALVQAVAGEKLKARIRVSKKSRPGRSKNSIALGKSRMGLVVKV